MGLLMLVGRSLARRQRCQGNPTGRCGRRTCVAAVSEAVTCQVQPTALGVALTEVSDDLTVYTNASGSIKQEM
jgi:hypothetical protein